MEWDAQHKANQSPRKAQRQRKTQRGPWSENLLLSSIIKYYNLTFLMLPFTESHLETSADRRRSEKASSRPGNPASLTNESSGGREDDFLESIAEKVEPLDIDAIMKEGLEQLDSNDKIKQQNQRIDPHLREKSTQGMRQNYANQKQRSNHLQNPATKTEPSIKNDRHSQDYEHESPEESRTSSEAISLKLKVKQMEKKYETLKADNKDLQRKVRSTRIKLEQQFEDLYRTQMNELKVELCFEREKTETERHGYEQKIKQYEKKITKINREAQKKEEQLRKLRIQTETLLLQKKGNQEVTNRMKDKQTLEKQARMKRQLHECQERLRQMKERGQTLEQHLEKAKKEMNQAEIRKRKSDKQHEQLLKSYKDLEIQKKHLINSKASLQRQISDKNVSIDSFKKKMQEDLTKFLQVKDRVKKLEESIEQFKFEKIQAAEEMDRLQTELLDHKAENRQLQSFKKMVTNELSSMGQWMQLPKVENLSTKDYFQDLGNELFNLKYFQDSSILKKMKFEKKMFLVDTLREFLYCHSFNSQLVYRYDPLNTTNFHKYIDMHPNLLVLLEFANGTIIAGFSVYAIDPKRIEKPGKGLLISLTSEKVYRQREDPKLPIVSYDEYYFILGNAEIRLKTQEKKAFSNFGIANSTFQNGRDQRTDFLKVRESSNNELEIITYEFYELRAEQK